MNKDTHSLLWYTRAEIVRIRGRNTEYTKNNKPDSRSGDTQRALYEESNEILTCILRTLDDTLTLGGSRWSALFLAHVIQAYTLHLFAMKTCHDAYIKLGFTMLGLDNNYVRIRCHVNTVLDICKANLVVLCSSAKAGESRRSSAGSIPLDVINPVELKKRFYDSKLFKPASVLTRRSSSLSCLGSRAVCHVNPTKLERTTPPKDVMVEHARLPRTLTCRRMLHVHDTASDAMLSFVSGATTAR
jgi:hypothetical protein